MVQACKILVMPLQLFDAVAERNRYSALTKRLIRFMKWEYPAGISG